MNRLATVSLALVVGAAFGATAINRLQAQAKAPGAYAIVDISEITNADAFKQVGPKAGPAATNAGGTYIARTDTIAALDGTAPKRFVIIGFDSMDKAKAWYATPAQQEINAIVKQSTKTRFFIVEGMSK